MPGSDLQADSAATTQKERPQSALLWSLLAVSLIHTIILFSPLFNVPSNPPLAPVTSPIQVALVKTEKATIETPINSPDDDSPVENVRPLTRQTVPEPAARLTSRAPPILAKLPDPVTLPQKSADLIDSVELARIRANLYSPRESNQTRLIRDPFDSESSNREVAFHFRDHDDLDDVLNPVPDHLPFADGPQYALDFYDPGVMGDIQRFGDAITVEKEWITKHGTKVKCVWILIFAGCGWD